MAHSLRACAYSWLPKCTQLDSRRHIALQHLRGHRTKASTEACLLGFLSSWARTSILKNLKDNLYQHCQQFDSCVMIRSFLSSRPQLCTQTATLRGELSSPVSSARCLQRRATARAFSDVVLYLSQRPCTLSQGCALQITRASSSFACARLNVQHIEP